MADCTASVSGNWSNTATWGGSAVPVDNQSVAINANITVVFDVDQSGFATGINGITIGAGGVLAFATAATPTGPNGAAYLNLKTGTAISGGGTVRFGAPSSGTAVVDACQVEYAAWPSSGTAVTNTGLGGGTPSNYNGVLAVNEYSLDVLTGYTKQANTANTTDYIKIPHGTYVDNLGAHTLEFVFYLNALTTNQRVFSKGDAYYYGVIITSGTSFLIYRYDTAGTAYKLWIITYTFTAGGFYDIQIAWDATSVDDAHNPTVKINNVLQTAVLTKSGTVTAWRDDSAQDLYIANNLAHTSYSSCTHFVDRVHTRKLTDAEMTTNYYADMAHWAGTPITRPTAVTSLLVDDAVYNKANQTVVKCQSAAGFVVGGTIYLVNGAESGSPSTSLRETLTIAAGGVDLVNNQLTCTGNLTNSYTAGAGAYVTQKTIPRAVLNFAGAYSASSYISASGAHTINGWIPTTPTAHPAYTMLHVAAAAGQGYVDVEDGDFAPNAGEQVLISCATTAVDGNSNLYTVTKYEATGGADSKPRIHIYPALSTTPNTARAGGNAGAANNDYVAIYSRPIVLSRANNGLIPLFTTSTTNPNIIAGFRASNAWAISVPSGNTFKGITTSGTWPGISALGPANGTYLQVYLCYDCVVTGATGLAQTSANSYFSGCIAIASTKWLVTGDVNSTFVNCVGATIPSSNTVFGNSLGGSYINPVFRYAYNGLQITANTNLFGNNTVVGASTTGTGCTDIALFATTTYLPIYCYNCNFGSATTVSGNTGTAKSNTAVVLSYNQAGTTDSRYLWGKGGTATTNQSTILYVTPNDYGTMQFTIDATVVNTPIPYDTWFHVSKGRAITFNVPMYASSSDGITAACWIIDPANDPLWFQQFPSYTFLPSTPTASTTLAQGTVLAISYPTFAAGAAWQSVGVTVPAQTQSKELICRIIFMGTTASKNGYAYLGYMQNMLMVSRKRFV